MSGQSDIALPTNIYASKISEIVYDNGSTNFEIKRLTGAKKLSKKTIINNDVGSNPMYMYDLKNDSADDGIQIQLLPPAQESSTTNVTIEYIREANVLVDDDDKCDIPEFYTFLLAFVRWKVRDKEGHPDSEGAKSDYERERQLMIETLTGMTDDDASEIEQDVSHYEEMS